MEQDRAGVVGAGAMGRDIAALLAASGFETTVVDIDEGALDAARAFHRTAAEAALARAGLDTEAIGDRLDYATDVAALADCGFVVEAVSEDLGAKRGLLTELDRVLDPNAVIGTNTSSLTPGDIAARSGNPERIVLFHFAKPAIDRALVEIAGDEAADWAINRAVEVGELIGKKPIVFDREMRANGLSRLSAAIKCAASWELERASAAAIDHGARAMGFDRGPFELIDDIGLDVHLATVGHLREPYDGRFDPPPAVLERLQEMREAGRRGRKDGEGFFRWTDDEPVLPDADAADVQPIVAALVAEAHRMVDDGVADADTIDRVLVLGSAGEMGPFDIEAMVGRDHLRSVLDDRAGATGAAIYHPW